MTITPSLHRNEQHPPASGWTARVMFWFVLAATALVPLESSANGDPVVRWAGVAALYVVLQSFFLMWFSRVPEMRAFNFYLWLLPALAYAAASSLPEGDADARDEPSSGHDTR